MYDLETADPAWLEVFETACSSLETIHQLEALVVSDGLLSTGSTKQTVIHPAVVELRHQRAAYAKLLTQLGLDDGHETFQQRQTRYGRQRWAK
jgi:hypothetical protein